MRAELPPTVSLFDLLHRQSRDYWSGKDRKPPDTLWERADVIPIEQHGWEADSAWTCMRRDGKLVFAEETGDRDFPISNYNHVIGWWMKELPAASGYLRPVDPVMCRICDGRAVLRSGGWCGCGGLGWMNASFYRDQVSDAD